MTGIIHPLDDAEAKLARARQHLVDLRDLNNRVLAEQMARTVIDPPRPATMAGMSGVAVGVTSGDAPISAELKICVGEAANAFRSVLEYLTGELALRHSGTRHRNQFPIFTQPKDFQDRVAQASKGKGPLAGLSAAHIQRLDQLQPYNGARWTARLADLSNTDKHSHLVFVAHDYRISGEFRHMGDDGRGPLAR